VIYWRAIDLAIELVIGIEKKSGNVEQNKKKKKISLQFLKFFFLSNSNPILKQKSTKF